MVEPPINEHFRRALLETIPCAVFITDIDQRIVYWNPSAESLTGYAADEVLGRTCAMLSFDACDERNASAILHACAPPRGEETTEFECEIRRRDGQAVPVVRRIRPVRDDAGELIGAIQAMVDVSLMRRARRELHALQQRAAEAGRFGQLIGSSPAMRRLYEMIDQVAETDASVVIEGETGTGKELVARTIHDRSRRAGNLLLAVNCGALPEPLLEAELFGHAAGAFTGAAGPRTGRFEEADGGTLLLDEIGEMPLASQVKLLRALQEGEIVRVGENRPRKVDVRMLAATNLDLARAVAEGGFREDLYYRLRVVALAVPPLRDRREDIPQLIAHFVTQLNQQYGRDVQGLAPAAMRRLIAADWPGNVRQLRHAIEHAFVVTPRDRQELPAEALPEPATVPAEPPASAPPRPGSELDEAGQVRAALASAGGNKTQAARLLGITRAGLYKKLKRLDL